MAASRVAVRVCIEREKLLSQISVLSIIVVGLLQMNNCILNLMDVLE